MSAPVVVAVVSWNTRDLLRACLRSLEPDVRDGLAEVWVIDNGSADGSQAMVREEFPAAHLVESERNLGFGPAVNQVAEQTESAWLAPANADVAVEPGAIEALLAGAGGRARVGCVAPRLVTREGATQHSVHVFPPLYLVTRSVPVGRISRRLGDRLLLEGAWDERRRRPVDWADGAFLLVRREAFDAVGGFDERQWMYAEDVDLAWRLARTGWSTRYEPSAIVHHAVSAAARDAFGSERVPRQIAALYTWIARRRGLRAARLCAMFVVAVEAVKYAALRPFRPRLSPPWRLTLHRARVRVRVHRAGLRSRARLIGGDRGGG
ncbi:MAG: glycosyltransferase family 2 protein [Thermoleophilaceae bacterium]